MKLWEDARVIRGMRAQLELRRKRLAAGDAPLGWKVGFAAPAMLERLGITGPLVGFLTRNARVQSGVLSALRVQPTFRCEFRHLMAAQFSA